MDKVRYVYYDKFYVGKQLWYRVAKMPEEEYPFPLVGSRYNLSYQVEGEGDTVVEIAGKVVLVGNWFECCEWAERFVKENRNRIHDEIRQSRSKGS